MEQKNQTYNVDGLNLIFIGMIISLAGLILGPVSFIGDIIVIVGVCLMAKINWRFDNARKKIIISAICVVATALLWIVAIVVGGAVILGVATVLAAIGTMILYILCLRDILLGCKIIADGQGRPDIGESCALAWKVLLGVSLGFVGFVIIGIFLVALTINIEGGIGGVVTMLFPLVFLSVIAMAAGGQVPMIISIYKAYQAFRGAEIVGTAKVQVQGPEVR